MNRIIQEYKLGFLIAFLFLFLNLLTINDYGITWDEPVHFNDGVAVINYLRGKTKELEIKNPAYGQIPFVFSAISHSLFYGKLGILPFDSSIHLPNLFFASLAIFLIYFLGQKLFNKTVAFWSAIFLAFYPRFIGMTHQNIKDLPIIPFYCLSIYFFYLFLEKPSLVFGFLAGLSIGIAFNVKINTVFIPFISLFWKAVLVLIKKERIKIDKGLIFSSLVFLFSALFFTYLLRPAAWQNPIKNFTETISFYQNVWRGGKVLYFGKFYKSGINVPWHYSFSYLMLVTPIFTLIFFLFGTLMIFFKKEIFKPGVLLLIWFFLPLARYFSPKTIILDDIRHFVEVVAPLCLIAAVGIIQLLEFFKKRKKILGYFLFLIFLLSSFFNLTKLHPYESVYFNGLIGGVKGAMGNFDIDYWGFSLKEGSGWINKNVPLREKIYVHSATIVVPVYLRHDLKLVNKINEADYLMIINRPSDFSEKVKFYVKEKKSIFTIKKDGGILLYIFKNKP